MSSKVSISQLSSDAKNRERHKAILFIVSAYSKRFNGAAFKTEKEWEGLIEKKDLLSEALRELNTLIKDNRILDAANLAFFTKVPLEMIPDEWRKKAEVYIDGPYKDKTSITDARIKETFGITTPKSDFAPVRRGNSVVTKQEAL